MNEIQWFDGPLASILVEPQGAVGQDMARRASRVESAAKGSCPVDIGRLRSSIRWVPGAAGGAFIVSVVVVADTGAAATIGSDVEYSGFIEQGTRYMRAQPYLVPALSAAS